MGVTGEMKRAREVQTRGRAPRHPPPVSLHSCTALAPQLAMTGADSLAL